ncbi:MAG: amino acid--tRNA ligase-related protein [Bacteriovoracia bacterium]
MQKLKQQFQLIQAMRDFFNEQGFMDVLTPPMVENPGMETHIHPFAIHSAKGEFAGKYLHTSPEFHMKELLSLGLENIFTICYCFRDEPNSLLHRQQFLMLEWYRSEARYETIMDDCENLYSFCYERLNSKKLNINFERVTVNEIIKEYTGKDILDFLETEQLRKWLEKDFKDIMLPPLETNPSWDDYFFLLFLNKVEPELKKRPFITLYEYPHHLSALSTLKEKDPRVCERFEIYINGIEIANCFNELRDINEQKKRFSKQAQEKRKLYGYSLPGPKLLYDTLDKGFSPSAGIALGIERLLMGITGKNDVFYS